MISRLLYEGWIYVHWTECNRYTLSNGWRRGRSTYICPGGHTEQERAVDLDPVAKVQKVLLCTIHCYQLKSLFKGTKKKLNSFIL